MEGWIKLHRQFIKWEWYKDINTCKLFLHLILSANHKDQKWRGKMIERGQLITGIKSLHQQTGLSTQSIRTSLNKLKSTNELTINSTNKFSIITICKYASYQAISNETNKQTNKPLTNEQQTSNNQLTTNNNDNNINNDNNEKKKNTLKEYGKPSINELHSFLEERVLIDGTKTQNRNYCNLLLKKMEKEFPGADSVELIKRLIELGLDDEFHSKNITGFKYIYYNASKLMNLGKQKAPKEQKEKAPAGYGKKDSSYWQERSSNHEPKKISELIKK